jgi:hypothetical protein
MTLIRLIQRASILAGMTLAGLSVHSNPVRAEDALACVIANNGKTVCGTLKVVERACITTATGNTVCGKFKSAREEQGQEQARTFAPNAVYRKEVNDFVLTLESCKRVDDNVMCQVKILNKGKKRRVSFSCSGSGASSMIDVAGKSHPCSKIELGDTEIDRNNDTIASVSFGDIQGKIDKAQLLNLDFYGEIKRVQFRNIPISN